jgi:catechol 2,3-dioxygenase-like lactoylglutathione lyase family enzyme
MFDHITLRVIELDAATTAFASALDELEIEQTANTSSFSVWGNFALTQTDGQRPIARRVNVAFIAPSPAHVDRFWHAGVDAGFVEGRPPGYRSGCAEDYYSASLLDCAGNRFKAVYRKGQRVSGNVEHLGLRASDVEASTAFYSTISAAAGLTIRRRSAERAAFSVGGSDGSLLLIAGGPTENVHIAFSGDDDDVRRFHADAIASGYRSNGEPGERPRYHAGYYAAYVLDPDGNNIEVVTHHRPNVA